VTSAAARLRLAVERARDLLGPDADRALADAVVVEDLREIARTRTATEIEAAFAEARAAGAHRIAWVARRLLAPAAPPDIRPTRRRRKTPVRG